MELPSSRDAIDHCSFAPVRRSSLAKPVVRNATGIKSWGVAHDGVCCAAWNVLTVGTTMELVKVSAISNRIERNAMSKRGEEGRSREGRRGTRGPSKCSSLYGQFGEAGRDRYDEMGCGAYDPCKMVVRTTIDGVHGTRLCRQR